MQKNILIPVMIVIMTCRLLPENPPAYGNTPATEGDLLLAQADNPLTASRSFKGWPIQAQAEKRFLLSLQASYLQPQGDFSKITGPGASLLFGASYRGLLLENLVLGAETGFFFIIPTDDNITLNMLVPLYLTAAYDFALPWDLFLSPEAGIGYSFNMVLYKEYDTSSDELEDEMDGGFEPILMGGLALSYRGFRSIAIFMGLRYYGVLEEEGVIHIMSVSAGVGFRL